MQIIINIPKEIYERCRKYELHCGEAEVIEGAVANGTPLGSKTNGDVIKTLFPFCKTRSENTPTNFMEFTLDGVVGYAIEKSWWNASYKAESEDI